VCMRRLCRSAESKNPLRIQRRKAQEGQRFIRAGEAQVEEFAERKKQRSRPLEIEILPSLGRKHEEAQEEQSRGVRNRHIGVLKVEGTRASEVLKSRRDRDRPLEGRVAII
jgi:hypothetical protein